ncbi:MAG: polysaccharide deacetylase family protein [Clostridia bacterium]|nr:polysaccharide deacetylase family protein [Clostridia bacterium]MBR6795433.1 polysaccharide deacetylase family protein [Clostridia bacterium]
MERLMNSRRSKLLRILSFLLALTLFSFPICALESVKNVYHCSHTDEKVIALTFDDGPHPRYTKEILELLDMHGIRATFFMIGENISNYPESAKMVFEAGHEIGNHTDTHPCIRHVSSHGIAEEMRTAEKKIIELTGEKPRLFRPPEGLCSHEICQIAEEMDYSVILWTVDTRDWAGTPTDVITKGVMKRVRGGDILLFHDYVSRRGHTLDALRKIIPALQKEGYTFLTVSELLALEK